MFPVASQFDQLTGLTHLDISSSSFSGKIPLEISYLSKLSSLDLSDNYGLMFEGHVFETVVGNLTQLRHLLLSGVSMSSVEPTSFLNMSFYITTLIPEGNRLQGKFPEDVFQFSYLEKFHLNGFHCPYLKMFYPNGFQCPYPMKLFLNGSHCLYLEKFFYVEFHGLEINLPKTNWSGPLKSLELSSSHLQELPDSIGNLRSLEILDLSYTNLTGPIPATLANLAQLKRLDLSKNNLSGLLPIPVFNFTQVEYLDFSRNNLIGSLPSRVSGILRLHWLGLNENFLSERVLSWLFSFPSLEVFWLSNNKLTGTIDQSDKVGALEITREGGNWGSNLQYADLSDNLLTVVEYSSWKRIKVLKLGSNLLEGPLLPPPPSASVFLISKNRLTGKIPSSICNLNHSEKAVVLDLSHNNLSGAIPRCLGLRNISVLDLQMNHLHGSIPDFCVEGNKKLQTLNLNNNDFDGPLLKSLANCHDLEVLNLGNNKINDTFPTGWKLSLGYKFLSCEPTISMIK
ncbi:receptor-like protein 9DC1 [Hibiscus syriacus]|uniref:receptor-like protein 9DC1 n=1 Tax=Hibiscus syriacus TaxID=106335 RepID=UPI001922A378|nr:receptor-like protein 9DC1 [Hibiscus syriacus]